ncbi:hypothetical protein D3C86_1464550 [compost metagenome]
MQSCLQRDLGCPAELAQASDVQELARGAVRLGGIPDDLALEAHRLGDEAGQLLDGHVGARAHVDVLLPLVVLHQEDAGIRQIVHVQELAPGRARAPQGHAGAVQLGLVELADHRGQHVRGHEVEVVVGPVEVGGHGRDEAGAVLLVVGLAELDACDLGDGVPLVSRLQGSREQVLLLDGLRAHLGVDTRGA